MWKFFCNIGLFGNDKTKINLSFSLLMTRNLYWLALANPYFCPFPPPPPPTPTRRKHHYSLLPYPTEFKSSVNITIELLNINGEKICQGHVGTMLGPWFTLICLMANMELCNVQDEVILSMEYTIFGTIQGHILAMLGPGWALLHFQVT